VTQPTAEQWIVKAIEDGPLLVGGIDRGPVPPDPACAERCLSSRRVLPIVRRRRGTGRAVMKTVVAKIWSVRSQCDSAVQPPT
jgi:hypothetical protein